VRSHEICSKLAKALLRIRIRNSVRSRTYILVHHKVFTIRPDVFYLSLWLMVCMMPFHSDYGPTPLDVLLNVLPNLLDITNKNLLDFILSMAYHAYLKILLLGRWQVSKFSKNSHMGDVFFDFPLDPVIRLNASCTETVIFILMSKYVIYKTFERDQGYKHADQTLNRRS